MGLFFLHHRSFLSFPKRATRPTNSAPLWRYSCIGFVVRMTALAMGQKLSFIVAKFFTRPFCFALSTYFAAIFSYASIGFSILMPFMTMCALWVSSIRHLLFNGRPSAIRRFVVSVIIDSVNLVSIWPQTHILAKILKAIKPSIADFYASPAIVFIVRVGRLATTSLHVIPNTIHSFIVSYFSHGLNNRLFLSNKSTNKIGGYLAI